MIYKKDKYLMCTPLVTC